MAGTLSAFLRSEYNDNDQKPVVVVIFGRNYIIPYPYVRDHPSPRHVFLMDLFEFCKKDLEEYKKHGLKPRSIHLEKSASSPCLPVPFDLRRKNLSPNEIGQHILERTDRIYRKAVRLAYKLSKIYPDRPYQTLISLENIKKMQQAYYEFQLRDTRHQATKLTHIFSAFMQKAPRKLSHHITQMTIEQLHLSARRWGLRLMLSATVSEAVYRAVKETNSSPEDEIIS